jgi:hypothetical protein
MLEVDGAVESAAALAERTGGKRDIRPPTDTDGTGVRVESGRQESIGLINKNRQSSGFFAKKRIPVGGGWSDGVVTFFGSSPKRVGNFVAFFQLEIYIRGFSEA